jgi:crotonobetaine/carnitine-CoA ligase
MDTDYLTGSAGLLQNIFAGHVADRGDRPWCTFQGTTWSYRAVDEAANQLAHALRDEFQIGKGDAVGVLLANCPEYFVTMFAIHRLGAVYVPCSTLYSDEELAYQLGHCAACAVITDDEHYDLAAAAMRRMGKPIRIVVTSPEPGRDATSFGELLAGRPAGMPVEAASVSVDDSAMLMYTSGTTDRPKGVMFSHGNLTTAGYTAVRHFRWSEEDRYLSFFPLYHANGGLYGVAPAIIAGASIAMVPRFTASRFGQTLCEEKATFVPVNSTHVKMIMRNPETEFDSAHHAWRMMLGLTIQPSEWTAFETRFRTRLMGTYGLTETLGINVIGDPVGPRKVGSAGRLVRGYSLRISDDAGNPLPVGEAGEASIHSHQRHGLALGYYKDPGKSAEVFGEWLRTGDILRVDEDGYIWFVDRKKDMIKRSGFNVAAAEVERVIRGIAGVAEVAVVGTPDVMREEAIVAFVVPEEPGAVGDDQIFARCAEELAEYKRPQFVEMIEELPFNFLGKVERRVLRERALKYRIESDDRAPVSRRGPADQSSAGE